MKQRKRFGTTSIGPFRAGTGAHNVDYIYANGKLIAEGSGTQLGGNLNSTFLVQDRQSIRLSIDKLGTVLGQQGTLPFGEQAGESGTQEKHHFTTYETDAETGNDFSYHRLYAPLAGRFFSVDPSKPEPESTRPSKLEPL